MQKIIGTAAGVPFVAVPGARVDGPVVVAWHLLDPPRTEAAFEAAVPLAGLDAWRIYLGMPMSGSRLPSGGWEEVLRLATEDAVLNLHRPVVCGAAEEFGAAWAELCERFGLAPSRVGVMGGSMGAAVAQLVIAEGGLEVAAAVLISPVVRLRAVVGAMSRRFGLNYGWSEEADGVAGRLDFVARSDEVGRDRTAVLLVVGEEDAPDGFLDPAVRLREALPEGRAEVVTVPGMGHALAEEPGTEPAAQTAHAAAVDRLAVGWFERHLTGGRS